MIGLARTSRRLGLEHGVEVGDDTLRLGGSSGFAAEGRKKISFVLGLGKRADVPGSESGSLCGLGSLETGSGSSNRVDRSRSCCSSTTQRLVGIGRRSTPNLDLQVGDIDRLRRRILAGGSLALGLLLGAWLAIGCSLRTRLGIALRIESLESFAAEAGSGARSLAGLDLLGEACEERRPPSEAP